MYAFKYQFINGNMLKKGSWESLQNAKLITGTILKTNMIYNVLGTVHPGFSLLIADPNWPLY